MRTTKSLCIIALFVITSFPATSEACARTQAQLAAMLPTLQVNDTWAERIEGHWAKRAGGTGWNIIYYKQRLAFAIQNPITGTKDAQFIEVCPSSKGNDFTVRGEILGKDQNLEIKVSGQNLRVMSGVARGLFKKRNKNRRQILDEFSKELSQL